METNGIGELCADDVLRVINSVLRGRRRVGIPPGVSESDLRQEAALAVYASGKLTSVRLVAKIARDAMMKHLNARRDEGITQLETDSSGEVVLNKRRPDLFFQLPVDDGVAYRSNRRRRKEGPIETLAGRHERWIQERAEVWA